jgi:Sigma-70 region 2
LVVEAVIGFRDAGKMQRPHAPHSLYSMEEMNAERLTDVALMAAVVRRDADAMAAIYERYESLLRSVISSILHEGGETDDVLHEVFMQLWNRADRFLAEKNCRNF